jgi:hypothetical protein
MAAELMMAGCASLPTSGMVHEGLEDSGAEVPFIQALAAPPAPDASLRQIAEGFLQAMLAGASDDFQVARSYLTEEAAAVWDPLASVTVYQSGEAPVLTEPGTQLGRVDLSVTRVGQVDSTGRYRAEASATTTQTLGMAQNEDSQWRISSLPDGIVIPEDVFRVDYVPTPIYFPSTDGQFLVPDLRVFSRQAAATAAVKQFLDGPPQYLYGAVGAVVPSGTRLTTNAVGVADGVATVNLSAAMSRASESARATVWSCLQATLTTLPNVHAVEFQIESAPMAVQAGGSLTANPRARPGPFFLGDGGIWRLVDAEPELLANTEAAATWETLTVDHTEKRMAGLQDGAVQVLGGLQTDTTVLELPDGAPVTAPPAFDTSGWLWVASGDTVWAFDADAAAHSLGATWLAGREVVALAPSRDGSRLAVAVEGTAAGSVEIALTGIVRGQGTGPWRLTGPIWVGQFYTPFSSLSWSDGMTLAFLAPSEPGASPVPVEFIIGGDATYLKLPTDPPASLASGSGLGEVFAAGTNGGLFRYSVRGRIWSALAGGARAVTLAP